MTDSNVETPKTEDQAIKDLKGFKFRDLFFFNVMILPKIITVIYWLMLIAITLSSLGAMYAGASYGGFSGFMYGLFTLIFGLIGARITCELMIVLFTINTNVQKIANKS